MLLFNSILPFSDLLRQMAALTLTRTAPGLHVTARTETVRTEEQDSLHTLFFILIWGQKEGWARASVWSLCLGMQVPGPAQHGLQLVL